MITGTDLKQWGMPEGPLYKTALKIFNHPSCDWGKARLEPLVKEMLADPEKFKGHGLVAPIVKEMLEARKVNAKTAVLLNANHCPLTIYGQEMIEMEALSQIYMAAKLPVSVRAALMPDAHAGYGLPIGGVLAVDNAVIPYAVGVDIGCRMQMTIFDVPGKKVSGMRDKLENILKANTVFGAGKEIDIKVEHKVLDDERFRTLPCVKKANLHHIAVKQIGTSGGGNHFVEFGVLDMPELGEMKLAVLSHSGSRGMGNKIGLMYSDIAIQKTNLQNDAKKLAWLYLDDADGIEYWEAMNLAGEYAQACHAVIHARIIKALGADVLKTIQNHHNFAWKEVVDGKYVVVHWKGATPAGKGVIGLIPGSMTTPTYVVEGKGEVNSMNSSSHGAGRMMSRTKAKESFTASDMNDNLKNADVRLCGGGIDECSMAYKDIDAVMAAQADLVAIKGKFVPAVVCMAEEQAKPWEKE